ncbi:MAG: hypothetical protein ACE5I1_11315, partial [bacterium]
MSLAKLYKFNWRREKLRITSSILKTLKEKPIDATKMRNFFLMRLSIMQKLKKSKMTTDEILDYLEKPKSMQQIRKLLKPIFLQARKKFGDAIVEIVERGIEAQILTLIMIFGCAVSLSKFRGILEIVCTDFRMMNLFS